MSKITTITSALVIACLVMPATAKDKCKQAKHHNDADAIAKFCKKAGGDGKDAQPNGQGSAAVPTTQTYTCLSSVIPGLGTINCTVAKGSEDEAYGYCLRDAQARYPNVQVSAGALKCSLVK